MIYQTIRRHIQKTNQAGMRQDYSCQATGADLYNEEVIKPVPSSGNVACWNLGQDAGVSWVSSAPPAKFQDITLN
jgi:hypothetical protein